ncbi:MAG: phosphatidylinositol-specific phospholipase C domain-containing protein [Cyanobacteria bacterium P01_A01_bin.17]
MRSQLHSVKPGRCRPLLVAIGCLLSLSPGLKNPQGAIAQPVPQDWRALDPSTRAINEVTIPTTHNSYNYAPRFLLPNVNESIPEQLENGVRGIELDPHSLGKKIQLFHGLRGLLGKQPASEVLAEIAGFLQQHPSEVVVIKINSKVPGPELKALIDRAGLFSYLYVHKKGEAIPSAAELAAANRRVLITNAPGNLSSRLPLCTTRWNLKSPQALWPPREHRAPCTGEFFSVVAFAVEPILGIGSPDYAAVINDDKSLLSLAETAWKLNGKKVWRLEVDFPDIGNVYRVADTLNRWNILKGEVRHQNEILSEVLWNCQYSMGDGDVETTTYGRFAFPMKPNEKVTITPSHPDYVFSPASLSVTNTKDKDIMKNFEATRR